jgi:hypothetical protein
MPTDKEIETAVGEELLQLIRDTLRGWFDAGVEYVALGNGMPVETFTADSPACALDSARARGLEVLHLVRDMRALADSIVRAADHVCADVMATLEAQARSPLPVIRGQA